MVRTFRLGLSFPLPGLSQSESVAETNLGLDEELPEPETERDLERLELLELPREPEQDRCEAGLEEQLRSIV